MGKEIILAASDVSLLYGKKVAVMNASIEVLEGDSVALVGVNGSGKSTFLVGLAGAKGLSKGRILFRGKDITDRSESWRVAHGIVRCPEGRQLFGRMSVYENVCLGAYTRRLSRREMGREFGRVCEYFPKLEERSTQLVETLSGGEQQMVAIARSLMSKPKILMLDEPSLGLAPILTQSMFDLLREVRETGCSILVAEQNIYASLRATNSTYLMENGGISERLNSAELLESPRLLEAVLGK